MRQQLEKPTPRFDSFHFGMFTCASCLGSVGSGRISHELLEPVFGDQAETEIIIPAGRQSFHPACLREHLFSQIDKLRGVPS